jgi:hypothetical protein
MSRRQSSLLIYSVYVALLFLLVAYTSGLSVAAVFVTAGVVGYLNAFAGFRAVLSLLQRHRLANATIALAAVGVVGSIALCTAGYWAPLAICTGSFLVIDAVALRFRGQPVGASTGEP